MRVHYLQHESFEGPGTIAGWAGSRGHVLTSTSLFLNQPLPSPDSFDFLVIMGGSMNIYEEDRYPWLSTEKAFIREAISAEKTVLGICLGSQLVSDVAGGRVFRNAHREIGWFPVTLTEEGRRSPVFSFLPESFPVMHWHGDTFELPPGARLLASSEACRNQAYSIGGRVFGLQFHMEWARIQVESLIRECGDDLTPGPYVQSPDRMLADDAGFDLMRSDIEELLDRICESARV